MRLPTASRALCCALALLAACRAPAADGDRRAAPGDPSLVGSWRAVLGSPGGDLPFTLVIRSGEDGLSAVVVNGEEEAPVSAVLRDGDRIVLAFDWYDSRVAAILDVERGEMTGEWTRTNHGAGLTRMSFSARRGDDRRFAPAPASEGAGGIGPLTGVWATTFVDEDGSEPARGELQQHGDRVLGTFLTPTGDYRYLDGDFDGRTLRLSTFDGAHAFLFIATAAADGTLSGDFYSRDAYHATWTAERVDDDVRVLPDAWREVGLARADGRFSFTFPDLDGNPVSLSDERFRDKAVVVQIFGSWCPNCNDEAPLLAAWHRRYRDRGLEMVGLAYEFTGDVSRDREFVARYRDRHAIEYPLLLAGTSDKEAAAATLPDLTRIVAFPTTIFIDRAGEVAGIHSGFAGPGTGDHHTRLVAELEAAIEKLLTGGPGPTGSSRRPTGPSDPVR